MQGQENLQIKWTKGHLESMTEAQIKINKYLINNNFELTPYLKEKLTKLQEDFLSYYISICDVCGHKHNKLEFYDTEHIKIKHSWGYNSFHDTETHEITLCNACYDKHILTSPIQKYIKVTNYMS